MDIKSLACALALRNIEGLGDRTFKLLVDHFGDAGRALDSDPSRWAALTGMRSNNFSLAGIRPDVNQAKKSLGEAQGKGIWLLAYGDPLYPELLGNIWDPPAIIYGKGSIEGPERGRVAVVGSRRASTHGRTVASRLSSELCEEGLAVVSGLASGIDTQAHRGALEANGRTIAVLGSGVDVIYPAENVKLAKEILDRGGAILSEVPPGGSPDGKNFPRRNRIISGLCLGVVVVEAAQKSGSLITANLALEQGREVFAMPGAARASSAQGVNNLLRQGANFAEYGADVIAGLGLSSIKAVKTPALTAARLEVGADAGRILEVLEDGPIDVDTLSERAKLGPSAGAAALVELTLAGLAVSWPGNRYSLPAS